MDIWWNSLLGTTKKMYTHIFFGEAKYVYRLNIACKYMPQSKCDIYNHEALIHLPVRSFILVCVNAKRVQSAKKV